MAEFIRTEEKVINVDEPVIFENNTDSDFSVSAAIVFRKSGLYDVSIVGGRTTISKVAERPKGKWNMRYGMHYGDAYKFAYTFVCNRCGSCFIVSRGEGKMNFCPSCGADMRGE